MTEDQDVVEATPIEETAQNLENQGMFMLFSVHRMDGSVFHYATDPKFDSLTVFTGIDDEGKDFEVELHGAQDIGWNDGGVQVASRDGEITVFPWHTLQLVQSTWQVIPSE